MRFSKISITKKGVHLVREKIDGNGAGEEIDLTSPEPPMASFFDALQGFKAYVVTLLDGAIGVDEDALTITTLNLSEDKHHHRGLIVTATVPVENAYGKPLVLNMPLVREGSDNTSDDAFVLTDEVMALIQLAEKEATAYVKGDRMQLELPIAKADSANTKAADERMASAAVQSTRKPARGKANAKDDAKVAGSIGTPTQPWNPDKTERMTTPRLRQLLLMVERDVPEQAIERWTSSERDNAQRWGEARQKELAGSLADAKMPREPQCLIADGTKTLADGWTSTEKPPRAETVAPVAGVEGRPEGKGAGRRSHPHVQ